MRIDRIFKAGPKIEKFIAEGDTYFGLELVDPLFDKEWCDDTFKRVCNNSPKFNTLFINGEEIGDTKHPTYRYYLMTG